MISGIIMCLVKLSFLNLTNRECSLKQLITFHFLYLTVSQLLSTARAPLLVCNDEAVYLVDLSCNLSTFFVDYDDFKQHDFNGC